MAGKRFTRVVTQKRLTSWLQFSPVESSSSPVLLFVLNAGALALRPFTIVRSRFVIWQRSDQAAGIEHQTGAVGMAIVSDQASTIGVTAVPNPIADMGSDLWFFYQLIRGDESEVTDRTRPQAVMHVDSKAMRKVDIGQDLVIVYERAATVSQGSEFGIGGRMLIKVN